MIGLSMRARRATRDALLATMLGLLFLPGAAAAQRSDDDWLEECARRERRNTRAVHCDVRVETMRAPSGALRVDARPNGGVIVIGENRRDVEVHARIQANARSAARARTLGEGVSIDLGRDVVTSSGPDTDEGESWSVTFVVYVPAQSDLDLAAHNGPVSITDVSGTIEATTLNGPLALEGVGGDVTARTHNGPLVVTLSGSRWAGESLDAETRNGPVQLRIPEDYSAELETGTVNGPFISELPLTIMRLSRRDMRINTTVGRGGPRVRVVTTNGPVSIETR